MRAVKPKPASKPSIIIDARTLRDMPELGMVACSQYQSAFDKSIKQYVLQPREDSTKAQITINPIGNTINPQKLIFQVFLMERLRMQIYMADINEHLMQFQVCPKQSMVQRTADEVSISSSFILTKKWISLCFDFSSFFGPGQLHLKSLAITSACRLKQIHESPLPILTVSDGQMMVQRITSKRLQELVEVQNRCQSEDRPARRPQRPIQRQNTGTTSREREESQLPPLKHNEKLLIQKNIKIATGLQVIEEIQPRKRLGYLTQEPILRNAAAKKAVQSIIRHTDFQSPNNEQRRSQERPLVAQPPQQQPASSEVKVPNHVSEEFFSHVRTNNNDPEFSSFYNSKVGKFSNTFQKPLGFSQMNFKLAQQNSNTFTQMQQHSTQDYFYLSSQQFQQGMKNSSGSRSQMMESQVEEKIEAEEKDDLRSLNESLNTLGSLKQRVEDSSDDIVVSQFV